MSDIKLLDVGFVEQLQHHAGESVDGHPLWCSRFLLSNPAAVVLAHRDLIRVGCQVILTNTYQATVEDFVKHMGQTKESALELIGKSVSLVKEAIALEKKDSQVEIAGSVGPYGSSLHDGSEYTGSYTNQVTTEQLISWHEERVKKLVSSGIDLLAFETVPCSKEAVAIVRLLKQIPDVKFWISFSVMDGDHISNGEKFEEAVEIVLNEAEKCGISDRLLAIGCNCMNPKYVFPLFIKVKAKFPRQSFIVYPNSGENYNTKLQRWVQEEEIRPLSDYVKDWLDLGVKYIGGCCRTTSKDLPKMVEVIQKWKAAQK